MGRRKLNRTKEEEKEVERLRRIKKINYIQKKRQLKHSNISNASNSNELVSYGSNSTSNHENITIDINDNRQLINGSPVINNIRIISDISVPLNERCLILTGTDLNNTIRINDSSQNSFTLPHVSQQQCHYQGNNVIDISNSHIDNINNIQEHYLGTMNVLCIHCKAKHFSFEKISNKGESFNDCCSHGKVVLPSPPSIPTELCSLFDYTHPKSKHFHERIRAYNSSFSFASFNTNLINFQSRRPGPYCFKIQGQIYYQINTSLYPDINSTPSYGQLFIIDQSEANTNRLSSNSELDIDILQTIDTMMRNHNKFAKSFQMMHEEIKKQEELALQNNQKLPEMQLLFTLKPGMDRRRFNFQQVNEVAAIFTTNADGEIPNAYVTIRNRNTMQLTTVSSMDPNVEAWVYPLFFPHGTQGWHRDIMRLNDTKRVSRSAYVKYQIAIKDDFNVILRGGRLFQQWLVDNYVKIEKDRITYHKENQAQLRIDTYQGLQDYLQNRATNSNSRIGKVVVLPATFIGSPRYMLQNYQDAMAIVRKYDKPDLFITMTCNPNWREIKDNLLPNQTASDRPDLVARVFHLKKNYLLDLIVKKKFFGDVAAYVYVIEFQKRGLPHIHLLLTLKSNSKLTTANIIDKYISAEIPDSTKYPKLHQIVMQNMIHGPCGNWCLVDSKCSKHFPKSFQDETIIGEDGYPSYRRRNTNKEFIRPGNYVVDNRYIVLYSPKLTMLFNCHINVEVVSSIKSVKYLFKYVYKGHDCAAVTVGEASTSESVVNHDEIQDFIETRYVSSIEAAWRILSKPLQDKSHSIERLPVHLPNHHNVILNDEMNDDEMSVVLLNQTTKLTAYFELNAKDNEAKHYLYAEIPTHYTFKKEKIDGTNVMYWNPRKSHYNTIGRMYSVSPTKIELFHLRLLLLTVKGATSFENLRTVNGIIYSTFSDACLALGLIDDDDEWQRAMHEAKIWMMPQNLRRLFVRILIHCQPLHPNQLWKEFKEAMSEDYARSMSKSNSIRKAYSQINSMLIAEDRNLTEFPGMEQIETLNEINDDEISTSEAADIGRQNYEKLNEKQKEIVDTILQLVNNTNDNDDNSKCFYIDGPGGSGKTFIYNTLWYLLKSQNKQICTMAFTGIAATLLPHSKTVHKTFGLPVPLLVDSSSNIKLQSKESKFLSNTDVFIWDEAPMSPRYALEIMDRTLRDITNKKNIPFGGKIVLLGGDFRQLLPIQQHSTRNEIINLSIKFSPLWKYFTMITLIQNMRVLSEEIEFSKFLLNLGDGVLNNHDNMIEIPACVLASTHDDIVHDIYNKLFLENKYDEAAKCAILSARNKDVDEINDRVVQLLDVTTERIYTSVDSAIDDDNNHNMNETLLPEYLNTLQPNNLPPYELRLRIYTVIMLIRNLSIHEGLCNGTRLLILELGNNLLRCKILTGDKAGETVFINRITLHCEDTYPFKFKRKQFPIKLAFAMTINKSQGQTFSKIGIDLRRDVFNHGQLYVACSRVRSWDSLKIYLGNQRSNSMVKNYVYKEMFL